MGKYFIDNETVRVAFPDGEWIDVKEELSQEDQDFILNKMAHASAKKENSEVQIDLGKLALLQRSIVSWSFKDGDKPIPVDREHISNLRQRYRQPALEKIDELNSTAAEFRKNLETAST